MLLQAARPPATAEARAARTRGLRRIAGFHTVGIVATVVVPRPACRQAHGSRSVDLSGQGDVERPRKTHQSASKGPRNSGNRVEEPPRTLANPQAFGEDWPQ